MQFIRRLGWFLAGLSVGLVFLAIFLRRKADETGVEFCYLPNCRVLKELRSKPLAYSAGVRELLSAGTLDSAAIAGFLRKGDVDFGKSDTGAQPCTIYFIELEGMLEVHNCPDSAVVTRFIRTPEAP